MIGFDMGGNVIGGPGTLGDPDDEKGWNLLNLAQPNQQVGTLSSLFSQVVTPSMVDHYVPTPLNPNAVPTMRDIEKMTPKDRAIYNTLDFINDPTQIVDPVYNFVDKSIQSGVDAVDNYVGNLFDLDPETLVNTVVNSTIGQTLGAPLKTIGDITFSGLEAAGLNPEMDTSNYGKGQGILAEPDSTPAIEMGMGIGGGPDAANMSLDDFGIPDPLGLDNALGTNIYSFPKKFGDYQVEDFNPNLQFNTNIPNPAIENMYNDPDAANRALDIKLEAMGLGPLSSLDNAVFNLDNAIASTGGFESAFGTGYSGISPDMGAVSQEGGGELQEALAQKAAETIIAQQAARQPESNKVTIPVSSGPDIMIDVTPPKPQTRVAPHRRAAPKPSPVQIAAKSITKPKAFKALPKFAQKELRQGKVPTGGSDNVQDMVRDFLGGQKAFGDSGTRK